MFFAPKPSSIILLSPASITKVETEGRGEKAEEKWRRFQIDHFMITNVVGLQKGESIECNLPQLEKEFFVCVFLCHLFVVIQTGKYYINLRISL